MDGRIEVVTGAPSGEPGGIFLPYPPPVPLTPVRIHHPLSTRERAVGEQPLPPSSARHGIPRGQEDLRTRR